MIGPKEDLMFNETFTRDTLGKLENLVRCDDITCMYNRYGNACNAYVVKIHNTQDMPGKVHNAVCQTYERKEEGI